MTRHWIKAAISANVEGPGSANQLLAALAVRMRDGMKDGATEGRMPGRQSHQEISETQVSDHECVKTRAG